MRCLLSHTLSHLCCHILFNTSDYGGVVFKIWARAVVVLISLTRSFKLISAIQSRISFFVSFDSTWATWQRNSWQISPPGVQALYIYYIPPVFLLFFPHLVCAQEIYRSSHFSWFFFWKSGNTASIPLQKLTMVLLQINPKNHGYYNHGIYSKSVVIQLVVNTKFTSCHSATNVFSSFKLTLLCHN